METSPLICPANQWTGFNMTTASVMKELIDLGVHSTLSLQFFKNIRFQLILYSLSFIFLCSLELGCTLPFQYKALRSHDHSHTGNKFYRKVSNMNI